MIRRYAIVLCLVAQSLIRAIPPVCAADARTFKEGIEAGGELKYVSGVPVLFLEGTPVEMGRQQGLLITEAARPLVGLPKQFMSEAPWAVVVPLCRAAFQTAPERYRRELEAAAEAGALSKEERDALIVANVMLELQRFGGCSSLVVEPSRSATGQMAFGRNLDRLSLKQLGQFGLVTIYRPKGKHAFASVGFPGFGGVFSGINDAGLALATHSVGVSREQEPPFNPLGASLYFTFRQVLEECRSVDEAERLLRKNKRYTKSILLVTCDTKRAAVLEITTRKIVVRDPEDGLLICTNHYRTPALCRSKQCARYEKLERLRNVPLAHSDVTEALRSVGSDGTLQSMIFEPVPLRLRVALGRVPIWDRPFVMLDLATLFRHKVLGGE